MRIFKIILIIILSVIAISVTAVMLLVMSGKINLKNLHIGITNVSEKVVFDKTYDEVFDDIKIDSDTAKIEILNSDDNMVKVTVYDDYDLTTVTDTDNNLGIKIKTKKCKFICFKTTEAHIVIYLPSNYDKKITVNNEYGDIILKSFPSATLDVDDDYGDIKVDSIANLEVDSDFGDVRVDSINNYVNIKGDCGDVRINNLNINENSNITTDMGDIRIENTNDIYISAKTDLGDVDIKNNNKKSDITLKIKTDLGDIKVK